MARNTLRGFIGICELKILARDKFNTVVSELRCRAALSECREEGRLLPFFPTESFYTGK